MRKHMIHPSLYAYEFMELAPYKTYVYALRRDDEVYIIDTFCGSIFMDIIGANYPGRDFVAINTHYHFDHIRRNYSFSHCPTCAHQLCRTMIQRHGMREPQEQKKYFQGAQTLTLPDRYSGREQLQIADGPQLFYTPGYTLDGISVYDQVLNVLFVGNTPEKPLIQIGGSSPPEYRQTLEYFLTLPVTHLYVGHTLQLTKADVRDTLACTHTLSGNEAMQLDSEETQGIHLIDLNTQKQ